MGKTFVNFFIYIAPPVGKPD